MYIRVDDFPAGNNTYMDINHIEMLYKISDILNCPYLIGVVASYVDPKVVYDISKVAQIGVHGITHYRGYLDFICKRRNFGVDALKEASTLLGSKIFVPPFNWIPKYLPDILVEAGYETLCVARNHDKKIAGDVSYFPKSLNINMTIYGSTYFGSLSKDYNMVDGDCIVFHYPHILKDIELFSTLVEKLKNMYTVIEEW